MSRKQLFRQLNNQTVAEIFERFVASQTAKGVSDKTILALILGLLTSASTALQFYRKLTAKKEKDNDTPKPPRGYGDHI